MFHWASIAVIHDPKSKAAYAALRARGASHGRALRSVTDRLLKMLCSMLEKQELYDRSRRVLDVAA